MRVIYLFNVKLLLICLLNRITQLPPFQPIPPAPPSQYVFSHHPPPLPEKGPEIPWTVSVVIGVFASFALVCCYFYRRRKAICPDSVDEPNNVTLVTARPMMNMVQVLQVDGGRIEKFIYNMAREKPIRYSAQKLCSFTHNYSVKLGSGGFGVVYKGKFPNGMKIAVKVLNRSLDKRAEEQFMAEVAIVGRTYHINLVRLYGFCSDHLINALVYEYMETGSLDKYLFSKEMVLEWEKLHGIAIGTAKDLAYLHEDCQERIIHYDIKPGNVLLDTDFTPKVADFGLAKLCNRDNTHVSDTGYRGTPGYSAPEFLLNNYKITHRCDVYRFGMLLFEMVGKRKNTNTNPACSLDWFPKRVWDEYEKGGLWQITVECGIEEKDREKAERMFKVALWCVQDSPEARPPMSNVVRMLGKRIEITPPAKPFQYLYSVVTGGITPLCGSGTGSSDGTSGTTDPSWYTDTTTILRKYDIQMASL